MFATFFPEKKLKENLKCKSIHSVLATVVLSYNVEDGHGQLCFLRVLAVAVGLPEIEAFIGLTHKFAGNLRLKHSERERERKG